MSQNLQNFVKFQKFQFENLVDFEKCCKTHIFLQKSEPIQPKTSNILPKFCQPTLSDAHRRAPRGLGGPRAEGSRGGAPEPRTGGSLCWLENAFFENAFFENALFENAFFAKFCKFLAGSFSAVTKRNFARKYAFDSIFQALQDLHPFAPLQSQNFRQKIGLKKQQFS